MNRLLLLACLLAPAQALALADPSPGPRDSRVRVVDYDPMQIVRVCSTGLTPVTLILEDGERAGMIAGLKVTQDAKEATDWFATKAGNMVTLQPLRDVPTSVLTIAGISEDKPPRPYQIELCTRSGDIADHNNAEAYMTVRFRYRAERAAPDPSAVAAAQARRDAARASAADRAARTRLTVAGSVTPVCRSAGGTANCDYDKRDPVGCPLLAPTFVWDDGIRTTLTFAPHATLPAVYVLNQDNKEAVQSTIASDTPNGPEIMLPTVYRYIRLRRGGKVCELHNKALDPYGQQPGGGTGTISPDVALEARAR